MTERIQMITQILELCATPRSKNTIMQETSLNLKRLEAYLDFLLSKALLEHNSDEYVATKKGQSFIEAFTQLTRASSRS